ncbi:MAG: FAD-binding protein [Chloroflexi bacterium]|nr:FAD-binding protein [Chloroflexota bacterium]
MDVGIIEADVLVVGGGAAAVRAAIEAGQQGCRTAVVSKGPVGKSGASPMAGGAMMAALGLADPRDNPQAHFEDTVAGGIGLADQGLVRTLCEEAPARALELREYGVDFYAKDGQIVQTKEPGHRYPRSVRALGGGVAIMVPLRRQAGRNRNLFFYEDVMALRLLVDDGRAVGVLAFDIKQGRLVAFIAPATILATGGYQDLYPTSDAAPDATGDGYAMALEASAELVDMEMLLYYPTALDHPPSARGILMSYEYFLARRGMAAHLVNAAGEDILADDEPLPTRDVLSRRIFEHVRGGKGTPRGGVYIDFSRCPYSADEQESFFKSRTPVTFQLLSALGIPMVNSRLEVAPAAHYVLGGIRIDSRCETSVPGLFAAGEVAGNVHGANRLAGNAISETQVFGRRAGHYAAQFCRDNARPRLPRELVARAATQIAKMAEPKAKPEAPVAIKGAIRQIMLEYAGTVRTEEQIEEGLRRLERIAEDRLPSMHVPSQPEAFNYSLVEALEAQTMATVGRLVCQAALLRRESRGHHFRADYPNELDPVSRTSLRVSSGEVVGALYPV